VIGHRRRIYAARLAGREARIRERPATALTTVVAELVEAIMRLPEGQVDLFGHCSGAIIAFEVARALRDIGAPALGRMIVVGQVAPRLFADGTPSADEPRRYIPDSLVDDVEMLEVLLPVMEADLRTFAAYTYAAGDPLDLPIAAVRGGRDRYVSDNDLATWSDETTASFVCRRVDDADHLFSGDAWGCLADEVLRALG
jgi:surfactin synthase thioesterase subunit